MVRNSPIFAIGVSTLVALAAVFSACGMGGTGGMRDMGDMHGEMRGGGSQAPQTPVAADASRVTVEIRNFDFFPRDLTAKAGARVTWVNEDAVPHDATEVGDGWGTGALSTEERTTLMFDTPGSYEYLCTIHPNMKATLTVT